MGAPRAIVGRSLLPQALVWILLITGGNALLCVLTYELGFGRTTFLFGPADRFADLVKLGLSYKALLAPHLTDAKVAAWPELYRTWYVAGSYAASAADPGQISNLHLPPLGQVVAMSAGLLSVVLPSPAWTVALFVLAWFALAGSFAAVAVPRGERTPQLLAGAALVLVVSYPALFMITRANLFSGLTTLGVLAFCLRLFRLRAVEPWALLALAVAMNFRPNAAIFALAIPLTLGVRASVPHLVRLAVFAGAIFLASLGIAHWLRPDYGLATFAAGLKTYAALFVAGPHGDPFNSSLLALLKVIGGGAPIGALLGIFNVLSIGLLVLAWFAARSGRLRPSAVCFLLTSCYALCTPVFGDYHLLVFVAPLLLLHLEAEAEPVPWDAVAKAVAVAAILLLSAKNVARWHGHSIQVVLNPLIALGATLRVAGEGLRRGAPAGAGES